MTVDENEHVKEVYARFGLAVYQAQVLEHGIVNALIFLDLIPSRVGEITSREQWEHDFDEFMGRHFDITLGRMIRRLNAVATLSEALEGLLRTALERRNWLAHDYFRERATQFMTEAGRDVMIRELMEARDLFAEANGLLGGVIAPLRERHGITDELLGQEFRQLLREAKG